MADAACDQPSDCAGDPPERVAILHEQRLYDGFFTLHQVTLRVERYDGGMSAPMTRLLFERGDAVAVLPFDPQTRQVLLVQQFRYPAWVRGGPGWLWETIAGMHDAGRTVEEIARNEAMEEAGYVLGPLRPIMTFYPSPGACSERIHLYVAPVTPAGRVASGGGLPEHGEDIRVRAFSLDEALGMAEDGRIMDAKTIIALQHLARHWDDLVQAP
jgi:ADP-ribose pyrophosphatase